MSFQSRDRESQSLWRNPKRGVGFEEARKQELDQAAAELNVSRQAVIKAMVRQPLDRHHLAQHARKAG